MPSGSEETTPSGLDDVPAEMREAILAGLAVFRENVDDFDTVRFTITSEFDQAVRDVHPDKEYAEAYRQSRPLAFAVAKSIRQDDGSYDLIIDASLFAVGSDPDTAAVMMEHEALHVAIGQRSETTSDLRLRKGSGPTSIISDLVAMTGVASEEYRVERVLHTGRPERSKEQREQFEDTVRRFYAETQRACRGYQDDLDVEKVAKAVLDPFHALATWSAYLAAALQASGLSPKDLEWSEAVRELVLTEAWDDFVIGLQALPNANTVTPREDLDAQVFDVAELLDAWLESVGFTWRPFANSAEFRLLRPWQWAVDIEDLDVI